MLRRMEDPGKVSDAHGTAAGQEPVRPVELLEGVGAALWEAFNAMQATRQRHFDLLEAIEAKKKKYNIDATERDTRLLAHLLADHDLQVHRFTAAGAALKALDGSAHRQVFTYIGAVNHALDPASDASRRTH